ncbi:hypothetical protein C0J52_09446 [Blattella germanica]|nr:hypothetical protein C0J52_09446 [Blattella germanica]
MTEDNLLTCDKLSAICKPLERPGEIEMGHFYLGRCAGFIPLTQHAARELLVHRLFAEDVKSPSPFPEEYVTRRRSKRKCRRPNNATRQKNADVTTVSASKKKDINNMAKHNLKEASVYPDPSYEVPDFSCDVKMEMTCEVKEEVNNEKEQSESHDENSIDYLPPIETARGFLCHVCNRSFSSKSYLRDHQAVHSGERSFICADCGKAFYSDRKLALHIKTHSAERPCLCSVCGKSFREKSDLKKHFRLHSDESPFLCNVCGR